MSLNQSKGSAHTNLSCLFIFISFIYFSFETGSPGWLQTDRVAKVILELFLQLPHFLSAGITSRYPGLIFIF